MHITSVVTGGMSPDIMPTVEALNPVLSAFAEFNGGLFDGRLPSPLFTLGGRRNGKFGHYCGQRFGHTEDEGRHADEILLNPSYFKSHGPLEILQTIVHEMVHQEQGLFGRPGKSGYHNLAWADRMESVGLMPSSTGAPGGKRIGRSVSDYVIAGGRFEKIALRLLGEGWTLPWAYSPRPGTITPGTSGQGLSGKRMRYGCAACKVNAWGRAGLHLVCGSCSTRMLATGSKPSR